MFSFLSPPSRGERKWRRRLFFRDRFGAYVFGLSIPELGFTLALVGLISFGIYVGLTNPGVFGGR